MFIRRNMSSNVSYQELKQYPCFKQLAKVIDVLILKQILPMVVKKVSLDMAKQTMNKNKMMYIAQQNFQNSSINKQYDSTYFGSDIQNIIRNKQNPTKMRFLMIEIKIYSILKYLFYKKIQCMEHLKNFQKLNFFYRSNLDQVPFGGYVYRKDDQITHIYYLVRGQIRIAKCIDQKEITICNLYEGTFFGLYEFNKNKIKRLLNAQSNSNNTIVLSISLDMLTQLFGKDQNEVLNKLLTLPSQIQKIRNQQRKSYKKQQKQNKNHFIKAYEFQRRLIKFSQQRNINKNQTCFNKFIENKSLLFKIKDSNQSLIKNNNQFTNKRNKSSVKMTSNFHKNQATQKYYHRLNKHRLHNLDSSISRTFDDKQNVYQKPNIIKPSQLLSSRIKQRFNNSKKLYSSSGFGSVSNRNCQIIQLK